MRISSHLPILLYLLPSSRLESLITSHKPQLQNQHSKGHRFFISPPKLMFLSPSPSLLGTSSLSSSMTVPRDLAKYFHLLLSDLTTQQTCTPALDWAGIELIFFVAARMVLGFGSVLETVLIAEGCFSYCPAVLTQHQGPFCSSPCPTSKQVGGAPGAGRGHSRDS